MKTMTVTQFCDAKMPECERGAFFLVQVCNCRRFFDVEMPERERGVDFWVQVCNCHRFSMSKCSKA